MSQPWQRQRDDDGNLENNLWYSRFNEYRLMGPDRSLLGCVNLHRVQNGAKKGNSVPGAWEAAAKRWNWKERAEAWDEHQRQQRESEDEAERLEWRRRRRDLLHGFFGKLADALKKYDTEDATLGQLTQAVRTAAQELRAEYDDEPTQRQEISGKDGGPIVIVNWDEGDAPD